MGVGRDFRYVIVGGIDTYWSQIARTIHDHPEYGSRLFHHASANDDELTRLYRSADFLLAASVDEGFGLPVMEARQFGLPVVCSDIAVFRELCPDASFFPIDDLAAATARVAQVLDGADEVRARPLPPVEAMLTWRQSTILMREAIAGALSEAAAVRPSRKP